VSSSQLVRLRLVAADSQNRTLIGRLAAAAAAAVAVPPVNCRRG